jgi:hypothetical protein
LLPHPSSMSASLLSPLDLAATSPWPSRRSSATGSIYHLFDHLFAGHRLHDRRLPYVRLYFNDSLSVGFVVQYLTAEKLTG